MSIIMTTEDPDFREADYPEFTCIECGEQKRLYANSGRNWCTDCYLPKLGRGLQRSGKAKREPTD